MEADRLLLSIIIPSYNSESTLRACLDSFLPLAEADETEIIVVDDGSRDSTRRIADEYCKKRPDLFSVVSRPNGGHGAAVNTGMEHARGEYIRVVDSDDAVSAYGLRQTLLVMHDTRADVILDAKEEWDTAAGTRSSFSFPEGTEYKKALPFGEAWSEAYSEYFMIHNMSMRRDLLDKNGVRARVGVYYDDFDFMTFAGYHARTLAFSDAYVYQYSVGNPSQSTSAASMNAHYAHHVALLNTCLDFYRAHPANRGEYLFGRMVRLIRTHYTLAFLYGENGTECRARARIARRDVANTSRALLKDTDSRYLTALILSFFPPKGKLRRKISSRKRG